jgi:putative N-acetyltransferase (TIGR04045 family)
VSSPSSTTLKRLSVSPAERDALECRAATDAADLAAHFRLRRRVFVDEQGLFTSDDRDAHDEDARTVHVVALVGDEVFGAVRIYPLDEPAVLWKGDRLAVAPERRTNHLGAALVRFAVATAGRRGGRRMIAQIQLPNVAFFEHLGWSAEGKPKPFVGGVDHQLMSIGLRPRPPR